MNAIMELRRLVNREDAFGAHSEARGYVARRAALSDLHLRDHLLGKVRIGAYALSAEDTSVWGCIDVDKGGTVPVLDVLDVLRRLGIPHAVERSKSKGYHVWILLSEPVPAAKVRALLLAITKLARWPEFEVFPKQNALRECSGKAPLGNFVNLPLFGLLADAPSDATRFLDLEHGWKPYEDQVAFLEELPRIAPAQLDATIETIGVSGQVPGTGQAAADTEGPRLEPSEIARILAGLGDGERHNAALKLAGHFAALLGPHRRDEIEAILRPWCDRCTPPADWGKIQEIIRHAADCEAEKRKGGGSTGSADELITSSGLAGLEEGAALPTVESALRALAAGLDGGDPIRRATVREGAVRCLEKAGVRSPAALVDAALAGSRQEDVGDVQGKAVILTDPAPWPEPVDGAALLDALATTFCRFLALPEGAADAQALWVLHSHSLPATFISPILAIISPEKRCGKTTLLEIVGALVPRRLFAANITAAALFRAVEKYGPSLLVDEADTFMGDHEELKGILNAGHTRTTAVVVRTVGDDHEPRTFSTWCAKAIALIGHLSPTLEDRSIVIRMRRRAPGERVERLRRDRLDRETDHLRRQAARWAADHLDHLRGLDPALPEALHDRAQDNWRPLVAIADAAGGDWPKRARQAALVLNGAGTLEQEGAGVLLLADLQEIFRSRDLDRLPTAEILEALHAMEERPWPEWRRGKPMTARQLAQLLRRFGVTPNQDIRIGERVVKGYLLANLMDPLSRYLPPLESATRLQANAGGNLGPSSIGYTGGDVADVEQGLTPHEHSDVADVADSEPPSGPGEGVQPGLPLAPGGYPASWDEPWDGEEQEEIPF